jgi:hypothetical protein
MKTLLFIVVVGVHALACLSVRGQVISYTMGIDVNCPSGLSE